jgi:hypothetical protein
MKNEERRTKNEDGRELDESSRVEGAGTFWTIKSLVV